MGRRSEPSGNVLLRQTRKDLRRSERRLRRTTRRIRRRHEGGWVYRLLWPDPVLAIGGYLLIAAVITLAALLIYGQLTHGGDPLWWARDRYPH